MNKREFQEMLEEKARLLYRDMPWRSDTRPYYVLVSELMLQQTQVERVIPKFTAFIARFPDEAALAKAPLSEVLQLWSGLGYNRRAKFLHEAAKKIINDYNGVFPSTFEMLQTLPGVGKNTAGAIMVYAYNQSVVFIETNVRTVFFEHFFTNSDKVTDAQVAELLEQMMNCEHPREFYWALMDYGSWLKRNGAGRIAQSKHYKKQSPLKGSVREVRGQIVKHLTTGDMSESKLRRVSAADERFPLALDSLLKDGLITRGKAGIHLTK